MQSKYGKRFKNKVDILARKIRAVEEKDSKCNQHPRFKKSDDLTIVSSDYEECTLETEKDDSYIR